MGSMAVVRCRSCGYESETLMGVGGDVGMAAEVVLTVACPVDGVLHDTEAGRFDWDAFPDLLGGEDHDGPRLLPSAGPCPTCGKVHSAWDADAAICPKCGSAGCQVEWVGIWD